MKLVYVVVALKKGIWYYWTGWDDRQWDEDLYCAQKFSSYDDAQKLLKDGCDKKHWGGFFKIEPIFVNK